MDVGSDFRWDDGGHMFELVTTDGFQYIFRPEVVLTVTDFDPVSGERVTCVSGISGAPLKIAESVDGFLNRVGLAQAFYKFRRGQNHSIWINRNAIRVVRAPVTNEYANDIKSVLSVGSSALGVVETPNEVKAILNGKA